MFHSSFIFFTQCQSDSKAKSDTASETTETTTAEEVTPEVLTPEQIAKQKIEGLPTTTVEWTKKEHDFGDINKGEKQKTSFTFKNTGDAPLIIAEAKGGMWMYSSTKAGRTNSTWRHWRNHSRI